MSTPNLTIEGKILDTNGPVFAERNGERIELQINDPIYESDIIITDEVTTTDILYRDGTKSRVAPNTRFTLTDYEFGEGDDAPSFVMDLAHGAVRTATGEIVKLNPEAFEVITPRATVGIRGTEFLNEVDGANETHAVLYISGGSVMVITDSQGNSITFDAPLQVTRFSNATGSFDGVNSITLGQMESVLSAISPTIAADIPQNSNQQGEWNKVEQIQIDQENDNQDDEDQDDDAENSDDAQKEADDAAEEALNNPPENLEQGQAQTVVIVAAEGEEISDLVQKQLEDAGFNVVIVAPEDANNNLNNLIANSNNEIIKPDFEDSGASVPAEVSISFHTYKGGNLTDSTGNIYTPESLASSTNNIHLQGIEILGQSDSAGGLVGDRLNLTTGSGNDRITLGATYSNGSYTDLINSEYTNIASDSPQHSALFGTNVNTGAGDDTIYVNASYIVENSDGSIGTDLGDIAIKDSIINMGEGNDTFITYDQIYTSTLDMGNGNNSITLGYGENTTVTAGSGNDTLTLLDKNDRGFNDLNIDLGAGSDTVNIYGSITYSTNINLGDGNDAISLYSPSLTDTNIELGNGNDLIFLASHITPNSFGLEAGDGNDIFITTTSGASTPADVEGTLTYSGSDMNLYNSLNSYAGLKSIGIINITDEDTYLDPNQWTENPTVSGEFTHNSITNLVFIADNAIM